ncbi:FAD-dependent oxidoreductase, partial [Rhizobium johnstonii]
TTYAHAAGWPIPVGGSGAIVDALVADLVDHGGELVTDHHVASLTELPRAMATLLDVTPRAFARMAGGLLPGAYRRRMERFRYGDG